MNYSNKTKEELIKELEILKQNQENISLVLNNIKEMFYQISFDENGNKKFEYLSSQIEEVLGLSKKEYIENQDKLFEYFHPNDIDELTKIVTNSKKEKTNQTIQYRFFNKKLNKYVWIEESFTPTYNDKGKLKSIFGSAKNVTEKIDAATQKEFILENIEEVIYNVKFNPKNSTKELVFISPQIKQLIGLTQEEFTKEGISGELQKRIHPDDLKIISKTIRDLYDNKKTRTSTQFRFKPKGREEYIWLDETLNAKYDKEGNLVETITVLRDITESKQLSDKIKVSEKSYKDLLNNSPDLIYMINDKGQFIDVNATVLNVLGYKKEELIGKTPAFLSNKKKNDVNEIPELIKKAKRKTQYFDWWIIDKNGKASLHEIILRKGMYLGKDVLVATGRDITERVEYQNKLKNNQEKLNLVLENIKEGIYSIDFTDNKNRNFDYSNSQLKRILGKNLDDFVKTTWDEKKQFYHPDDIAIIENAANEIFSNKEKPITVEYRFKKKTDKDYSWLEEKIVSKFDSKGKLLTNFGVIRDITKQKVAELHLKEKEELYRNLFTKNLAGVFITENDVIIECNNSFAKYFGYKSRVELIGKNAEILYYVIGDRDKYIKDLYKNDFLTNYRLRQKRKDGSELWVLTNVSIVNKQTKRVEGTLIEITDQLKREQLEKEKLRLQLFEESNKSLQKEIAERKVIEQQLIQNQKYTNSIINSSLDIICASDNTGKIIEYNKAAQKAFGYTKNEIKNKDISNVYAYKEDYQKVINQLSKKGVFVGEITNINKKGETFTSFLSASVLKNEKGEIIGTMGVSRDITEMKKAEQQLIESEEKYRDLFENASDLIQSIDALGNILYVNNAWKKALGYTAKELKNRNIFEFIHQDDKQHCEDFFTKMMNTKKPTRDRITFSLLTKKGKKIIVDGDISSKIEEGKMVSTRAILRDITAESWQNKLQTVYNNIAKNITEKINPLDIYEGIRSELGKIIDTNIFGISYKKSETAIEFLYFYDSTRNGVIELAPRENKKGVNEYLIKNQKPIILYKEDLLSLKKEGKIDIYGPLCKVLVGVPLKIKNKTIGFITIQSYDDKYAFDEKTIEILEFFSGSIALTVQRKYDESKIYEQSARLKSIIEIDTHMIWTYDMNKGITSFNKKFAEEIYKLYGYKPYNDIHKLKLNTLLKKEKNQPFWDKKYQEVFEGKTQQFTIEQTLPTGEKLYKEVVLNPIFNEDGTVSEVSGISHDVTDKKIAEEQTKQQTAKLQSIIENRSHLFWTYHKTLGLTSYNQNYYKSFIDSYGKEPTINNSNLFKPNSELDVFWTEKYSEVFKGKKIEFITERKNPKGQLSIKEVFLSPIFNEDGSVSEVSGMAHDITEKMIAEKELKNSLKEKEILLKEVHHRVKNNLQVISSILNLQSSYIHDEKILTILKESQNRIKSMAFIHESLYQTNDFSQINFSEYVVNLSKNLVHSYLVNNELIELKLDINKVSLNLDLSIPCGLIINELVSNALKYAFPENRKNEGYILISLKTDKENIYLSIADNGVGLPKNLDFRNTESLGLQLVTTLVEQINGTITQENTTGTTYNIIFKHTQ